MDRLHKPFWVALLKNCNGVVVRRSILGEIRHIPGLDCCGKAMVAVNHDAHLLPAGLKFRRYKDIEIARINLGLHNIIIQEILACDQSSAANLASIGVKIAK